MASEIDWSRIGGLAQIAARAFGQTVLRYQYRVAADEVRFYFGSGWYADIDGDAVAEYERDDGKPLRALMEREFRAQYERHGKPIRLDPDPVLGQVIEAINSHCNNGATRRDLVIFVGQRALASIQRAWSDEAITAPLCPHGGAVTPHHPRQVGLVGEVCFEQNYRGEIMGVPILFDRCCPADFWTVQRAPAEATETAIGRESLQLQSCKLCGKPAEVFSLQGVQITSCSCVESFAGGRCAGVMFDEKQWREAIEQAARARVDALAPALRNVQRAEPFSVKYKGAPPDKQARIDLVNDAFREAHDAIKRSGKRWFDTPVEGPVRRDSVHRDPSEHDVRKAVLSLHVRGQEQRNALDGDRRCRMGEIDTDAEAQARAEWSRQLREKQAEARRKEREQVVVDIDWD